MAAHCLPATLVAVAATFIAMARAAGRAIHRADSAGERGAFAAIALVLLLYLLHNLTEATLFMRGLPLCNLALVLTILSAWHRPRDEMPDGGEPLR